MTAQENRDRHKVYRRVGFGYLAYFRTMRFLIMILITLSVLMIVAGTGYYATSPGNYAGYNYLDYFSLAN